MTYQNKKKTLYDRIFRLTAGTGALAFSGGVDSALLLRIAAETTLRQGQKLYAVTADTQLHPSCDAEISVAVVSQVRNQIRRIAEEEGLFFRDDQIEHVIMQLDEFACAGVQDNPVDRCYLCKKYIYRTIQEKMTEKGADTLFEGTNLDDTKVYRPGIRALQELGIISPLMECGITKEEVRRMTAEYGLEVAARPSTPCMATRFPYGTRLTQEDLKRVEMAEKVLRDYNLYNVRARVHGEILRIEVDPAYMEVFIGKREAIVASMKELGYLYVTLDLEGFRSGSMDVHLSGGDPPPRQERPKRS